MSYLRHLLSVLAIYLLIALPTVQAITCSNTVVLPTNPENAYTENGNGTVSDKRNGLMWQKCAEGLSWSGGMCSGGAMQYAWGAALMRAFTSSAAGYSDWRLPNVKELSSLVERCLYTNTINNIIFPATPSSVFWSGSPDAYYSGNAWGVDFNYGNAAATYRYDAHYVRLVRGGQLFAAFDGLKTAQVISFATAPSVTVGGTGSVSASASSGLTVAFSSTTTGICTVTGSTVRGIALGTCIIAADQPGDSTYSAAPQMTQNFGIAPPAGATAPTAPTISTKTPGRGSATLQLVAPTANGGSAIVAYVATCTASGQPSKTARSAGLTLTVRGLKGGVLYSCTVTASNTYYSSVASAAITVTPQAGGASLTPILMLLLD